MAQDTTLTRPLLRWWSKLCTIRASLRLRVIATRLSSSAKGAQLTPVVAVAARARHIAAHTAGANFDGWRPLPFRLQYSRTAGVRIPSAAAQRGGADKLVSMIILAGCNNHCRHTGSAFYICDSHTVLPSPPLTTQTYSRWGLSLSQKILAARSALAPQCGQQKSRMGTDANVDG
eukprot:COSAG02_NODE_173_length_31245_cov_413.548096_15_plen_175_part_00